MNSIAAIALAFAASLAFEQETAIDDALAAKNICRGYDAARQAFTAYGTASARRPEDMPASEEWELRRRLFFAAHAKARKEIAFAMAAQMQAFDATARSSGEGRRTKSALAGVSSSSRDDAIGFAPLAVRCGVRDGACTLTLALEWSEERERRARASLAGALAPSPDWEREMKEYFARLGEDSLAPFGLFEDSRGFVHFFGADIAEHAAEESRPRANIAEKRAQTRALAALQAACDGTAAFSAHALAGAALADGAEDDAKALSGAAERAARGAMRHFAPVAEKPLAAHAGCASRRYIVYAAVPEATPQEAGEAAPQTPARVQVWNPATRRFEQR